MTIRQVRVRGEEIRRFLLENVEKHPTKIARFASDHFRITRQAIHKHLQRLVSEKALIEEGQTRNRTYRLAQLIEWHRTYSIAPELAEDVVWSKDISLVLGEQPQNVSDIWHYGVTEMLNNAMDHSEGSSVSVFIKKTAISTKIAFLDNGIGIFKKIQAAMNLLDERHAVLELAKGKFTTDPEHHSGEGIFFTSRMFDHFHIISGGVHFSHQFGDVEDWIFEREPDNGTWVSMEISNHTARTVDKVFDQFASGDGDYGFNKTVVPVRLAQYGNDKLISRSQAKRLLARVELFKTVLLDFAEVPTIGQAFADEVFRVFPNDHPQVDLVPIHYNSEVHRMITRVRSVEPPPENNQLSQ